MTESELIGLARAVAADPDADGAARLFARALADPARRLSTARAVVASLSRVQLGELVDWLERYQRERLRRALAPCPGGGLRVVTGEDDRG